MSALATHYINDVRVDEYETSLVIGPGVIQTKDKKQALIALGVFASAVRAAYDKDAIEKARLATILKLGLAP